MPRSEVPVLAASDSVVFAPSAMAVKMSSSIAAPSASVSWNAIMVLKMRSGFGLDAGGDAAMTLAPTFEGKRFG
jgi:hypothetical protein